MYKFCGKLAIFGVILTMIGAVGAGIVGAIGFDFSQANVVLSDIIGEYNAYSYDNDVSYTTMANIDVPTDSIITSDPTAIFDNIEVNFNAGSLRVEIGDEFKISAYDIDMNSFSYSFDENNTLKIVYNPDLTKIFNYSYGDIYVTLPEKEYHSFKVNSAGGECYIYDVITEVFDGSSAAGYFSLSEVIAKESCKFDISASNGMFSNCSFNNAEFNLNAGDITCSELDLIGNTKVDMNLGKFSLGFSNHTREDYYITSTSVGGSVNIVGDSDYEDTGKKSENTIDINNNLGSCDIYFY